MSTTTSWGPRSIHDGQHTLPLLKDGQQVGTFTETPKEHTVSATVYEQPWQATRDDAAITATLPDGRAYNATGDKGRIGGSKKLDVDLDGRQVVFTNEAKQDWVIETPEGEKLGQFTGGGRGVRTSLVEWEDTQDLDEQQQAFCAFVARVALESRLWRNTWVLTASLLVLAPLIVLIYLYGPIFG